ncbi:putative membrane protein [Desulfosporosinus acidiphilus SJ4]|uniref:Putative membrane protein n=1 Tax=Desulfosporosinus acidiphilus (strain DSM 22704 / JCM 16185 / SJ4) TaxID=646529 RepID=I4D718_DESAJ|nr:SHOCT domain-containing protein [Desulfosporosinus acidiphilus]AFM41592.1 putative membrane protein [Desulfosporosinus acidiphilus SJ4]
MMYGWGNMMGGWGNGGYGFGGYSWISMIMMMAMMIIPLISGIWIILYLFRRKPLNNFENQNTALNILRERYARGEIDSVEFQSKKRDLEGK